MNKQLEKVKKMLESEIEDPTDIFITDDPKFETVEVCGIISFMMEKDELGVTFYSGAHPCTVAWYIRMLHRHKIYNYIIFETMYPKINEKDEFIDMLFGDDADEEYRQNIFRQEYKNLYMAHNAITVGPKQ